MSVDIERVRAAVAELLSAIGEDPGRDGLIATPDRVAAMYEELFSGLHDDPARHLEVTFAAEHDEMVMVRDIPFASLCEHHLVPFLGKAHVAYIPAEDGRITGLSKLARLVDGYALAAAGPRAHDHPDRRRHRLGPFAARRAGGDRGGTPLHVDARRQEAGHGHGHLVGARLVPLRRGHPGRGHAVHPGSLSAVPGGHPARVRPLVMGVLNVTPDSFSDGGLYATHDTAVAHGHALLVQGADVVDIGGESSRPGAEPVPVEAELARVVPVIEALAGPAAARGARLSVDTLKAEVATAAVAAGASLVNDISASLWEAAAETGAGWVAMHMQGEPRTMQDDPHYVDVVAEVHGFVLERAGRALAAGVTEVWVDPGIGFGKTTAHNLSLLHHLPELVEAAAALGCAGVVVGTSRKRFLGMLGADAAGGRPAPPAEREEASLATAAAALVAGAGMVRVHDVVAALQVARLYGPAA